ncbi:MAG: methyltransferase [Planctomycetes bacterium]|nr:methyltransferase [Planctomycetota bacterium]
MTTATQKKASIPEIIRAILSEMEQDGHVLKPYRHQLERKTYEDLNKVLVALGGKWKRGTGHVFACSADELADKLDAAIESGEYECPRGHEYFPTPPRLSAQLIKEAEIGPQMSVLEPSAGDGALLRALFERLKFETDVNMRLRVIELMPENQAKLKAANIPVHGTDFETHVFNEKFDRVIMNPPFRRSMVHILKAYSLLEDGGRLVSIAPAGVTFRQDRDYKMVRMLAEESGWIEELPEGSFKASGTMVNTVMLCIEK